MQIHIVATNESVRMQALYAEWAALSQQCGHSFASFPYWHQARLQTSASLNNVFFVTVYDQQALKAVLPFVQQTLSFGPMRLHYLELFYSNEMGICDIASDIGLSVLWPNICRAISVKGIRYHFIKCQHYLADSNLYGSGLEACASFTKISHQSSSLVFEQGYDEFIHRYNTKFRRNIRRLTKKAKGMGELSLRCVREKEALEEAFQHFLIVEDSGWKGEQGTSIQKQPKALIYYQTLLEGFAASGACQINLLMLDDKCIAAQFGVLIEKTLYLLKIGYDQTYSSISPGQILLDRLVAEGADTQVFNEVSFVTGYGWMDRWAPNHKPVFLSYLPAGNRLGRLFIALLKIRARFKRS